MPGGRFVASGVPLEPPEEAGGIGGGIFCGKRGVVFAAAGDPVNGGAADRG
jgi:hypothetical protein